MQLSPCLSTKSSVIPLINYFSIMDAIPSGIVTILKGTGKPDCLPALDPMLTSVGNICFATTTRNNNRNIRSLFQRDVTRVYYEARLVG